MYIKTVITDLRGDVSLLSVLFSSVLSGFPSLWWIIWHGPQRQTNGNYRTRHTLVSSLNAMLWANTNHNFFIFQRGTKALNLNQGFIAHEVCRALQNRLTLRVKRGGRRIRAKRGFIVLPHALKHLQKSACAVTGVTSFVHVVISPVFSASLQAFKRSMTSAFTEGLRCVVASNDGPLCSPSPLQSPTEPSSRRHRH